jgi:hypothetical protein
MKEVRPGIGQEAGLGHAVSGQAEIYDVLAVSGFRLALATLAWPE